MFNKGLSKDDQKEGLFKRLKNIENKNEKQLKSIEDKNENQFDTNSKSLKSISYFSQLTTKAKELFEKLQKKKNDIDSEKCVCVKTDETIFNFTKIKNPLDLASNIYRNKSLLKDAEDKQNEIKILLNKLRKYSPTKIKKIKAKEETLSAAEKLLNNRQEVIKTFKTRIFPYIDGFQIKEKSDKESERKRINKCFKYIEKESKGINYDLFKTYFNFSMPSALVKQLYETKDKNKNNELVKEIKNSWSDLKDEIENMFKDEKKIEQPDKILKTVKKVLDFNKQNQIGKGLKILTPDQMLSRLPVTLAQLKAGNNSEKLKNEIRQLLYSLYRSKKLTKQIYKSLIDTI